MGSVMTTSIVVGRIFLSTNKLFRVEKFTRFSSTNLINHGGFLLLKKRKINNCFQILLFFLHIIILLPFYYYFFLPSSFFFYYYYYLPNQRKPLWGHIYHF